MKKIILIYTIILLNTSLVFSKTWTVGNSGYTFSPDNITIQTTDMVDFQINSIHTVVEVDQSTWNTNGNTPLSGGFSLPYGGGTLSNLSVGTHYYVCGVHYAMGMKGIITVSSSTGINNINTLSNNFKIFSNPGLGGVGIEYTIKGQCNVNISLIDLTGKTNYVIVSKEQNAGTYHINTPNVLTAGIYFIRFDNGFATLTRKIIIL